MSAPRAAVDVAEVEAILRALVAIPSPNPPGAEAAVVRYLGGLLDAAGIPWTVDELAPGRPNLHAQLGPAGPPALVLNGHSDTMPPGDGWSSDPYVATVRDGALVGLGACDMKAGLAAMVGVASAVARSGARLARPLRLDVVVDEEATGDGSRRAAASQPLPEAVVIVEPTRLELVVVGHGQINVAYEVRGAAAHGSTPELGRNAVAAAARAIVALEEWAATRVRVEHPLVGPESASIGTVEGGMKTSVVPDRCRFSLDLRVAPARDPDAVAGEADGVVAAALAQRPGIAWRRETEIRVPPFQTPAGAPVRAALAAAHAAVLGAPPRLAGLRATTDAAWYAEAGAHAVIYGAGDLADAHRPDERIALAEVATLCEVLLRLVLDVGGAR